ncbi:MAG: tRNA pseudouridine(55) synthase TruB [Candidatus Kerfeldbacteria bacterium]|nr:tRNA pseudouridine(55) synthase TruB [Candidatus Kerfeldbacteria bacterium]
MLLIDKPRGMSSFAVVAQARRSLHVQRVGHAGTLDPLASGLLIVLVGRDETKQQDRFMKLEKEYEVTIELGKFSTTDDAEGGITENTELKECTEEEIQKKVQQFVGTIEQTPPAYSAIHIDGERAYKLARRGETVAMPTRTVTIHGIEILEYAWPMLSLRVQCSHGTYIRSLARDLGGYVTVLRRTKIGEYDVTNAIAPNQMMRVY